jgi:cytochrome bd-type quinol oxidase subunit 2
MVQTIIFMQKKIIVFSFLLSLVFSNLFLFVGNASAALKSGPLVGNTKAVAGGAYDVDGANVVATIATVIQTILGFTGIVFVCYTIYAGFLYLTAEGDETKTKKALGIIKTAIIGVIIIVAAYAITYFVFNSMGGAGGNPTGSSR